MYTIQPIRLEHASGFREVLDAVARERSYLALTEARSLEWAHDFVANNISHHHAQFVALDGDDVIGWCDILPQRMHPGFGHSAGLGMGLLKSWRGKGIGQALLKSTIQQAIKNGIMRIELEVYASNTAAIALYRKNGFVEEGLKKQARILDGKYEDIVLMALLTPLNLAPYPYRPAFSGD